MNAEIKRLIKQALREDIGSGDITSRALLAPDRRIRARIVAHAPGMIAGAHIARRVFEAVDRRLRVVIKRPDGNPVRAGQAVLQVSGSARSVLEAERVALNFLGHLSGIATLTHQFVRKVRGTRAKIMDTRKTIPGLRLLEKDAVRVGGGYNHRLDLSDAVLIKTNHLRASRLSIEEAVRRGRRAAGRWQVVVEVRTLAELKAVLRVKPDVIMLDNWRLPSIRQAVKLRRSARPLLEVSGGVTLRNVRAIARAGVDRISIGRLTHSAPALDVSLKVV